MNNNTDFHKYIYEKQRADLLELDLKREIEDKNNLINHIGLCLKKIAELEDFIDKHVGK